MNDKYKIIEDPEYGFYRIDPIPSQAEVEKYYKEEFYSTEYKQFNDSSLEVQTEEQDFFNSRWANICSEINNYFEKLEGVSLFDIGFGFAQALIYFREKGIHVSGLEPSPEGVGYARDMGLQVYQAEIEDYSCVGSKRFDVVTLINVLEHLRDPVKTIKDIKEKLLNPKGLLIVDVPNDFNDFQTSANAEYELEEWWLCPPNHINYFSASSLKNLLQRCGFSIKNCEASFPLEIFLLMGEVYIGNAELGKICHQKRVNFENVLRKQGKANKLSAFYRALANLDLGRQVTIYATN